MVTCQIKGLAEKVYKKFEVNGQNIETWYLDGFVYTTPYTPDLIAALQKTPASEEMSVASQREAFELADKVIIVDPGPTLPAVQSSPNFFATSEGVYDYENFRYIYQYKDHLGNTRLNYGRNSEGDLFTEDSNDYYPFGLNFINNIAISPVQVYNPSATYQNYKYQEQELQETGFYAFKWRQYMPDVGRFFNIDPLTEKYNTWSPYTFSGNRVVDARELEGLEPYIVTGRAFIPLKTVPNPMSLFSNTKSFKGDTRNNYDVNAKSFRTEQKVKVDFDNNKVTTLNNTASPSVGYDKSGKVVETSQSEKAGPNPTYTPGTMKDGSTTINMQVDASNKLVDGAPSINYDVNITLTQQENGSLDYNISGATDGFPAYEFFITNQATGNSTLIYGSNPNKTGDTPTALFPPMEKTVNGTGNIPVKEEKK